MQKTMTKPPCLTSCAEMLKNWIYCCLPDGQVVCPLNFSMPDIRMIQLQLTQADEALEGIRREICHKSYIYRTNVRLAANKKGKQRGYDAANAADRALRHHVRVYK